MESNISFSLKTTIMNNSLLLLFSLLFSCQHVKVCVVRNRPAKRKIRLQKCLFDFNFDFFISFVFFFIFFFIFFIFFFLC